MRRAERTILAIWGLFWVLKFAVEIEDRGAHTAAWEPMVWEGSSCVITTLWLLAQRWAARRWNDSLSRPALWFARHLAWFPLFAPLFVTTVFAMRHGAYALAGLQYTHRPWPQVYVYESLALLLYTVLWLAVIFGVESFLKWQGERERLLALQRHLAESELARLRAQLHPHFLFNALNTISSLMQVDITRADRLLSRLADLLRSSLQAGDAAETPLREELRLLRLYADIMSERYVDRARVEWTIAEETLDTTVPTSILQPLVENAFKHGVERATGPVVIRIDACRDGETLRVDVTNTGTLAATPDIGIGIANCRDRLRVMHDDRATLALEQQGPAVVARLSLPWRGAPA